MTTASHHIERDLFAAIIPKLCVNPAFQLEVVLDNVFAGHMLPSGAGLDRRMWAEVIAYKDGVVVFQSGVVEDGQSLASLGDVNLWQIRDFGFKENGDEAHMFWDVHTIESALLPGSVTNDPTDPRFNHAVTKSYNLPPVDRIESRLRVRPVGLDLLDDLIATGDLDPAIRAEVPTFTLESTAIVWTIDDGFDCVTR